MSLGEFLSVRVVKRIERIAVVSFLFSVHHFVFQFYVPHLCNLQYKMDAWNKGNWKSKRKKKETPSLCVPVTVACKSITRLYFIQFINLVSELAYQCVNHAV